MAEIHLDAFQTDRLLSAQITNQFCTKGIFFSGLRKNSHLSILPRRPEKEAMGDAPQSRPELPQLPEETAIAAKEGDVDAMAAVWEHAAGYARTVAKKAAAKYHWLDPGDLGQELLLFLPRILRNYEPGQKNNCWCKYLLHTLRFRIRDVLRREDPLGIRHPQKHEYPVWHRLGDAQFEGFDDECHRGMDPADAAELQESPAGNLDAAKDLLREIAPHRFGKNGRYLKKPPPKRKKRRPEVSEHTPAPSPTAETAPPATLPTTEPAPAEQRAPAKGDGWSPARRAAENKRLAKKKKTAKKKPVQKKADQEISAIQLLQLAGKFAEAAGGTAKAIKLLEQLSKLK